MWRFRGLVSVGGLIPSLRATVSELDSILRFLSPHANALLLSVQFPTIPNLDAFIATATNALQNLLTIDIDGMTNIFFGSSLVIARFVADIAAISAKAIAIIDQMISLAGASVDVFVVEDTPSNMGSALSSAVTSMGGTGGAFAIMAATSAPAAKTALQVVFAS